MITKNDSTNEEPQTTRPATIEDKVCFPKPIQVRSGANAEAPAPWAPWINITPGAGSAQYAAAQAINAAGPPPPDNSYQSIKNEFAVVSVTGSGGGIIIEVAQTGELYLVQSWFSNPGLTSSQVNMFVTQGWTVGQAGQWAPVLTLDGDTIVVTAHSSTYQLERRIRLDGRRIEIQDKLTNPSSNALGLSVGHSIASPGTPKTIRTNGVDPRQPGFVASAPGQYPDNPTIFIGVDQSGVGLVAEDNAFRLESAGATANNSVSLSTAMLGIAGNKSYTMRWALYATGADYFDFINALRTTWNVNFTVDGPWDFFSVESLYTEQSRIFARAQLERKKIKLFALNPWFEYYSYWGLTRDIYTERMQKGMEFIRGVVPDAKFLACMETNLTPVPLTFFGNTIPRNWPIGRQNGGTYGQQSTADMTQVIKNSPWADSVIYDSSGRVLLDAYYVQYYVDPSALNLMVYPTLNNYWQSQATEKIGWLLDTVGFDGIYFDQFSFTGGYLKAGVKDRYTYNFWDEHTVTLNSKYEINSKFADCALVSADARRAWIEMVLSRNKIPVCNTNPSVEQLQSLPTFRFMETPNYNPLDGVAPYSPRFAKGQLGSPLALGAPFFNMSMPSGETWNRAVIAGLRFGLLSSYYWTDFPLDGPLGGGYGPMNHFFPFTPVELHEGWVLGKERLVTCVSGEFFWPHSETPQVLQFDRLGRPREPSVDVVKVDGGYRVNIRLQDWWEIAVVK